MKYSTQFYVQTLFVILLTVCVFGQSYGQRQTFTFNEAWDFYKGKMDINQLESQNPKDWQTLNLPHSWNVDDVMDEEDGYYRGEGWYKKQWTFPKNLKGMEIYLHFEAAHQVAELFVNGKKAGRHEGGYTAFRFRIDSLLNEIGSNQIAVRVDNSFNKHIAPLSGDFTMSGGIYRDVWMIALPSAHFDMDDHASDGIFIKTPNVSAEQASLSVDVGFTLNEAKARKVQLTYQVLDATQTVVLEDEKRIKLKPGTQKLTHELPPLVKPGLWSPERPYLYTLRCLLQDAKSGATLDELNLPLGFRNISFDVEKGCLLNGKPIKLIGVNRHQDRQGWGTAMTDELHERDMQILRDMGSNFIRIAHYPQDMALVHACNRLGILASIEVPIVNYITEEQAFYDNCASQMTEMVKQYYNHPSIVIWTYMNEVILKRPFRDKSLPRDSIGQREAIYLKNLNQLAQRMDDIANELDPDRFTMIPNHQFFPTYHRAKLTTIPDIVGWNLYPGWYGSRIEKLGEFLEMFHQEVPDRPVIISEYGGGADPRIRSNEPRRFDFSIEYQTYIHKYYLKKILDTDFVVGGAIWNFADFNSEGRIDAVPHINSKGILGWDRKPKDAYHFYQSQLVKDKAILKIMPVNSDKLIGMEGSKYNPAKVALWAYTNLSVVEVLHNGSSLGSFEAKEGRVDFEIELQQGSNTILAEGEANGKKVNDFRLFQGELVSASLGDFFQKNPLADIRVNLGAHFHFTDDAGQVWLKDQPYQKGGLGYLGGEPAMTWSGTRVGTGRDIWGTTDDPLYQTQRKKLEGFRFDVPDGVYELTACLAELQSAKERENLIYNLGADEEGVKEADRIFSIKINDKLVWPDINLARTYGEERAVSRRFLVEARNGEGIQLSFDAQKGEAVLNGIRLKRIR